MELKDVEVGQAYHYTEPGGEPFGKVGFVKRVHSRKGTVIIKPENAPAVEVLPAVLEAAVRKDQPAEPSPEYVGDVVPGRPPQLEPPAQDQQLALAKQDHDLLLAQQDIAGGMVLSTEDAVAQVQVFEKFMTQVMREDVDYGSIQGIEKPFLWQSGAQWALKIHGVWADLLIDWEHSVEVWTEERIFFHYLVNAIGYSKRTGAKVGTAWGSCNTMEDRYRWRKASRECPQCGKQAIIKGKAEYGGGWLCWKKQDGCGAKFVDNDPAITKQPVGRVENPDTANLANTVLKMACKRAEVGLAHRVTIAGRFFTQDEDAMASMGDIPYTDHTVMRGEELPPIVDSGSEVSEPYPQPPVLVPPAQPTQDARSASTAPFQPPAEVQERLATPESTAGPDDNQVRQLKALVMAHPVDCPIERDPVRLKMPAFVFKDLGAPIPVVEDERWLELRTLSAKTVQQMIDSLGDERNWEKVEKADTPF